MKRTNVRRTLLTKALQRWTKGTGPWSKDPQEWDQVDLVFLEGVAEYYINRSDERGLLSGCIQIFAGEVRRTRGWPTPPAIHINAPFEYEDRSQ